MRLSSISPLSKGVVLEAIRRKDLYVVAILGGLILAASGALGFFGVQGLEIFVKDLAVNVLGLFSTILAVTTSCRLLPDEIKNRTLYPLLARPLSRLDLLVGKWVGAVLVTWIGFLILVVVTAVSLLSFGVHFEGVMLQYVLAKMFGLALICSVGVAMSAYLTPAAAMTLAFLLTFGSTAFARAFQMAYSSQPSLGGLFRGLGMLLPQTHLFDLGARAVYIDWSPVPFWVMLFLAVYSIAYSGAALGFAWLKFRRQAL